MLESNDDDEASNERSKELAARTLQAIRWLCNQNRLTAEEKRLITSDLIESVSEGKFSQAEVAFSLIIGGGRPSEEDTMLPADMSIIDENDMDEFCDVCKLIAKSEQSENDNDYDYDKND